MDFNQKKNINDFLPKSIIDLMGKGLDEALKNQPIEVKADFNRMVQATRSINMDNIKDHPRILNSLKFMEQEINLKYGADGNK